MAVRSVKLNTGKEIPLIGLGTWQSKPGEVTEAVRYAIKEAGYRHIDGAYAYGNEAEVGEGIRQSGVPRKEIFITSKIWSTFHRRVEDCLDITLERLGTDYVDLLLVHWPVALKEGGNHPLFPTRPDGSRDIDEEWKLIDTWKQMEEVYHKGKAKAIGVSNFSQLKLEEILPHATVKPATNQIELHPYLPQHKLIAYLKSQGIVPQAYSPLGSTNSPLLKDEVVAEIAKKHGTEPGAVLIGWHVAKDVVALPKSVTAARIAKNIQPAPLDEEDVKKLDGLAEGGKHQRLISPPWGVVLGFDDWYKADVQQPPKP
ncbi:hypothetical protein BOTBODRAFT_36891 [Botryobasidium botryosum FD-172 SS1]|uniref:NADP-dependent oxidoreductase domain-containing protein n=1 Tax=Botryobasidium botryosum (strain FD-172 SS1) TaxID=930990 RepID=A0A067M1L8_BOTB1|nr:hypothetical protein BOTBODRAFT_36891 [Botryobasidium botryosum FD-172 SS1]